MGGLHSFVDLKAAMLVYSSVVSAFVCTFVGCFVGTFVGTFRRLIRRQSRWCVRRWESRRIGGRKCRRIRLLTCRQHCRWIRQWIRRYDRWEENRLVSRGVRRRIRWLVDLSAVSSVDS